MVVVVGVGGLGAEPGGSGRTNDLTAPFQNVRPGCSGRRHTLSVGLMCFPGVWRAGGAARALRDPAQTGPGQINRQRQWKQLHTYC